MDGNKKKQCAKCNKVLTVSKFSFKNRQLGTYQSYCKSCMKHIKKSRNTSKSGFRKVKKENSLAVVSPELLNQWSNKNSISAFEISPSSMHKVLWNCPSHPEHEWEASPNSRRSGKGCPICYGTQAIPGVNDIATTHPDIASMWSKENVKSPHELKYSTRTKISFLYPCGHTYSCTPKKLEKLCPVCNPNKNLLAQNHPEMREEYLESNDRTFDSLSYNSAYKALWKCDKGHVWRAAIYQRVNGKTKCPNCYNSSSIAEDEVYEFILSLVDGGDIIRHDRNVLEGKELDIYIPEKSIAIEYNGLYFHSEARGCGRNYHYEKWKICKDKGIQLITIWEDDWKERKDIIKSTLCHKLGLNASQKIYARKTEVTSLSSSKSRDFLDLYHIQGYTPGTYYIGLFDNTGEIAAVSVWRKQGKVLYLDRYATSCTVVGGMGKLLKYVKDQYGTFYDNVVTFSDNEVSDGGLYQRLEFSKDKDIRPDYKYVVDGRRVHKFNYRKKKFKNDHELKYDPGMSESELAKLNGIDRVWDCGKIRWKMEL